jgi:5-methylcytosine-specific restriction endonuclease McrA
MYKCNLCEKEFQSYRGLNGHKSSHREKRYSVDRHTKLYPSLICSYCGIEKKYDPKSTMGKYCSNKCSGLGRWRNMKAKIEQGYVADTKTVRRYLIEKRGCQCSKCGIGNIWDNELLVLQVDHIDGNSDNTFIDNLRLLCPNCHSQTPTWCSRNKKNTKRSKYARQWRKTIVGLGPDGKAEGLHPSMTKFDSL